MRPAPETDDGGRFNRDPGRSSLPPAPCAIGAILSRRCLLARSCPVSIPCFPTILCARNLFLNNRTGNANRHFEVTPSSQPSKHACSGPVLQFRDHHNASPQRSAQLTPEGHKGTPRKTQSNTVHQKVQDWGPTDLTWTRPWSDLRDWPVLKIKRRFSHWWRAVFFDVSVKSSQRTQWWEIVTSAQNLRHSM